MQLLTWCMIFRWSQVQILAGPPTSHGVQAGDVGTECTGYIGNNLGFRSKGGNRAKWRMQIARQSHNSPVINTFMRYLPGRPRCM